MDQFEVATSGGVFGFVGRIHCDRMRPTLLAVNGSFPDKAHLHDLAEKFPGAQVLVAHLPGMGPPWSATTVPRLTAGLGEAVRRLVGSAPTVVYAISTGNILGLGLQMDNIVSKIADEPFLGTAHLKPFLEYCRSSMSKGGLNYGQVGYLRTLFGIAIDGVVENVDYRHLVNSIDVPTEVIVGSAPLSSWGGPGTPWPSLTSEADRAALKSNPHVRLHVGGQGTGHDVCVRGEGKQLAESLMHKALLEASKLCR